MDLAAQRGRQPVSLEAGYRKLRYVITMTDFRWGVDDNSPGIEYCRSLQGKGYSWYTLLKLSTLISFRFLSPKIAIGVGFRVYFSGRIAAIRFIMAVIGRE